MQPQNRKFSFSVFTVLSEYEDFSSARQLPVPATLYALRFTLLELWLFATLFIILTSLHFVNILLRIFAWDIKKTMVDGEFGNLFIEISEKMLYSYHIDVKNLGEEGFYEKKI